jgi:hypothetical protein
VTHPRHRLGPCDIVALIDAGEMGEVYRVRDTQRHFLPGGDG